jgi:sortase A
MGYIYLKKNLSKRKSPVNYKKAFSGIFFIAGLFLFSSAVVPILQYQIEYSGKFGQILNPLSTEFYNRSGNVLGENSNTDYTQLTNWFVTDSHTDPVGNSLLSNHPTTSYKISIPVLKIQDAVVDVGSMDLKKSLIQYPQTALPGQLGNNVIFGHSVLPQFFSSKSYLAIFATLYRLKTGDDIFIDFDHIRYRYIVSDMFEVAPTDLSVLEQQFNGRYLSLITCSPPGTTLRRLVVKAQIADF